MNDINNKQNENFSITLIASFRQKYTDVKRVAKLQLWLVVYFSVFLTVMGALLKNTALMQDLNFEPQDISLFIAMYCLLITFLDTLFFSKWIDDGKELAAKLQEKFDCYVYSMPWNGILCGDEPSIETIHKLNKKFLSNSKNKPNDLNDWYNTKVSSVDIEIGVLLCQRMSLNWDKNLRTSVNSRVTIFALLWFAVLFLLSVVNKWTVASFVIDVLIPFVPVFVFSHKLVKDNRASIDNLTRYKAELNNVWERSKDNTATCTILDDLRPIQNEIYTHRKMNRPVSDKFYWKTKHSNEDEAQFTIEQLISELELQ
jgi:hypothetical protein